MTRDELAACIDHTLLRADADSGAIESLCREAIEQGFKAVCVNPKWLPLVAERLRGQSPLPCSVLGFPLGATGRELKCQEAQWLCERGARELDMVIDVGALMENRDAEVGAEIEAVAGICEAGVALKVILETALLDDGQKRRACALAQAAGADFVKTSTGFGAGGATIADVRLLRECVGDALGVKASGGIRDLPAAQSLMSAGASRLGTSSGISILAQLDPP